MPKFSSASLNRLITCEPNLQLIMDEAIKYYNFTVREGHRSVLEQQALYAKGRTKPGQIVTNVDGINIKGMHNYQLSRAVDVTPYPGGWSAPVTEFYRMAGVILSTAERLGIPLIWGGDWKKLKDYPHFELGEKI